VKARPELAGAVISAMATRLLRARAASLALARPGGHATDGPTRGALVHVESGLQFPVPDAADVIVGRADPKFTPDIELSSVDAHRSLSRRHAVISRTAHGDRRSRSEAAQTRVPPAVQRLRGRQQLRHRTAEQRGHRRLSTAAGGTVHVPGFVQFNLSMNYNIPGGFMEANETIEHAARRELREETGLALGRVSQLGIYWDRYYLRGFGYFPTLNFYFVGSWRKGTPRAADDAASAEWIPLARLGTRGQRLAWKHMRDVFRDVRRMRKSSPR